MRKVLEGIRSRRLLEREVLQLRAQRAKSAMQSLIGGSAAMSRVREQLARIALSPRPVLVTGPTGSGKELAVRAIRELGASPEEPLLDLNCGAFPPALIESHLFGHERGAFTGADRRRDGYFQAVGKGTLFLDEIGELPLELQAKLLRVLETGTFRPVGATAPIQFMGRVIAATHVDLEAAAQDGRFRSDLFYRLNVLWVRLPALEERREDIPALVEHFVACQGRDLTFSTEAIAFLQTRRWPGNVREVRNVIDRLAVLAPEGPITPAVIRSVGGGGGLEGWTTAISALAREVLRGPQGDKLRATEEVLIDEALMLTDGNKAAAARLLGVHRKSVERRVRPTLQNPIVCQPEEIQ
jgi:DNA-binding NtrC family response regulator